MCDLFRVHPFRCTHKTKTKKYTIRFLSIIILIPLGDEKRATRVQRLKKTQTTELNDPASRNCLENIRRCTQFASFSFHPLATTMLNRRERWKKAGASSYHIVCFNLILPTAWACSCVVLALCCLFCSFALATEAERVPAISNPGPMC